MAFEGDWPRERMRTHVAESARVARQLVDACGDAILAAADALAATFRAGGKALLCGNGGSAADCQHMATEFVSRLTVDFVRPGLPALALTTDTSFLTAYANDCGYDGVFARQVQALGKPEDLLIGISTSGASANVVHAVRAARRIGMRTVVLIGAGGALRELADIAIAVPSTSTQYVQEAHIMVEHILCDIVERRLFGQQGDGPADARGPARGDVRA